MSQSCGVRPPRCLTCQNTTPLQLDMAPAMQGRFSGPCGVPCLFYWHALQHESKVQSQKREQCPMLLPPTKRRTGHLLPICNTGQPSCNSNTADAAQFSQQQCCTRGVPQQLPCAPEQSQHNCPCMLHMTQSRTLPTLNNSTRTVPAPDLISQVDHQLTHTHIHTSSPPPAAPHMQQHSLDTLAVSHTARQLTTVPPRQQP